MFEHGLPGLLIIVVALIFIFGGSKRLEDMGKGFGGFMREFNKAKKDGETEPTKTIDEKPAAKADETPKV